MANSVTQARTSAALGAGTGFFSASALVWRSVERCIDAWRHRSRSRQELLNLSDEALQDIGITRPTTSRDVVKPIWMP